MTARLKNPTRPAEVCQRISDTLKKGHAEGRIVSKPHSAWVRANISAANTGKVRTPEQRRHYAEGSQKRNANGYVPWNKGKKTGPRTRKA